jgi:hypothetical protein
MLGRRLLILAAVLLATGAMAAALTPRDLRRSSPTTTTTTVPPRERPGGGLPATGPAGAPETTAIVDGSSRRPAVVRVHLGTLLHLRVKAPAPDSVELQGLDRFEPTDQYLPARFDFFVQRRGTFPIRLRYAGRTIGRLVVAGPPL